MLYACAHLMVKILLHRTADQICDLKCLRNAALHSLERYLIQTPDSNLLRLHLLIATHCLHKRAHKCSCVSHTMNCWLRASWTICVLILTLLSSCDAAKTRTTLTEAWSSIDPISIDFRGWQVGVNNGTLTSKQYLQV